MMYMTVIVLLFMFAIFDLYVGVSNDAVNFLNSAIGSKVARFRTVLIIAAFGVFAGAVMSNGMMDVARHGVFHPQFFSYTELICIILAVMTTDVVLLDVFNSLGLPTSTTISLVFELLGGSVALALFKMSHDPSLSIGDLLNTEHALTMILAIFVSVAIAFVVGMAVQYVSRMAFSFNYPRRLRYFVGVFGGLAITAILYFMLIKNIKGSSLMTPEGAQWIKDNSANMMLVCFFVSSVVMQLLHMMRVNVLKVVVLTGTFALAMAFASNDLVNFIGVPLAGLAAFQDFVANGAGTSPDNYLMGALNSSARTPVIFLIIAGALMIVALTTSKKAQRVVKTSVDLSRQDEGDEMFGTSALARTLVRASINASRVITRCIPSRVLVAIDRQFNKDVMVKPQGAAFDLVRASINLVISALLIAWGTSYKLPLSTTYVTFMVAMGSSLADRAWGRESAVFRVTGVISVIGGWFITAGVAFVAALIVTTLMHLGGLPVMIIISVVAIVSLVRSNLRFKHQDNDKKEDELFHAFMTAKTSDKTWSLLKSHVSKMVSRELNILSEVYLKMIDAFQRENLHDERKAYDRLTELKDDYKRIRRRELLGLRRVDSQQSILKGTYFHLLNNNVLSMVYGMRRLSEVMKEHLERNFNPLPREYYDELLQIRDRWLELLSQTGEYLTTGDFAEYHKQFGYIDEFRMYLSGIISQHILRVQSEKNTERLNAYIVYLNVLQETQAEAAVLKQVVRNYVKFEE